MDLMTSLLHLLDQAVEGRMPSPSLCPYARIVLRRFEEDVSKLLGLGHIIRNEWLRSSLPSLSTTALQTKQ